MKICPWNLVVTPWLEPHAPGEPTWSLGRGKEYVYLLLTATGSSGAWGPCKHTHSTSLFWSLMDTWLKYLWYNSKYCVPEYWILYTGFLYFLYKGWNMMLLLLHFHHSIYTVRDSYWLTFSHRSEIASVRSEHRFNFWNNEWMSYDPAELHDRFTRKRMTSHRIRWLTFV